MADKRPWDKIHLSFLTWPMVYYVIHKNEIDVTCLIFENYLILLNNIYYLNNIVYQYLHLCDIGTHPPDLKTVT